MIDFEQVWLSHIIGYARLIGTGQLEQEWLGSSPRATSVTDPDELHEQVFDVLDAESLWAENRLAPELSTQATEAIDSFLTALQNIDDPDAEPVVRSAAWTRVKEAAQAVVTCVA
jgi:hypothetical protein